jgi:hypothetical protein
MENIKPDAVTGSHGGYLWLATALHGLDELIQLCPQAFSGKYVAVTSLDSGPLFLTEKDKQTGWQSRNEIAYSPPVQSPQELRRGGFDEWYIFDSPKDLGGLRRGNIFEAPATSGLISVFVNYGDFAPYNSELDALIVLFWKQLDQIQPQSYVAEGNAGLTFVTRDKLLFVSVCQAFGM